MSFTVQGTLPLNPATSTNNVQTVQAWDGSRFSPVNTAPATNASPPAGSADYGPYTTNSNNDGFWTFTVTLPDQFIIQTWDPADTSNSGTFNVYWLGPFFVNPSTNLVGWTAFADQSSFRFLTLATNVASGSNGAVLPQSSIHVLSTTGFASSGALMLVIGGARTVVTYTGTSGGNVFTGCALGSGTLATGNSVFPAYQSGNYRRLCTVNFNASVAASGDIAYVNFYSTVAGNGINPIAAAGIVAYTGSITLNEKCFVAFPVDPLGFCAVATLTSGTGNVPNAVGGWFETDF